MSTIEFFEHFPYSEHPEESRVGLLQGLGTPGETVVLSFSFVCADDVDEVELTASEMIGQCATVACRQIEIYVVNVWEISGIGATKSEPRSVAELLLKDDRAIFDDGYLENSLQRIGGTNPGWLYRAPDVRLSGSAKTTLAAGQPKQIWLRIAIPADLPASVYSGVVNLRTNNNIQFQLPLELEVLPFSLIKPAQDLMIWYRGTMNQQQSQFYVPPELFRIHLQDIFNHGFRSLSICESDRATAQLAIDLAEEIGFDRHIVFRVIPVNAEALTFRKLTPVFYVSDELDAHLRNEYEPKDELISAHRGHSAYCELLDWTSMSSIVEQRFVERLENESDVGYKPDILSLSLADNREVFAGSHTKRSLKDSSIYYYWLSHMEKPNLHRILAGCYLWKSGADGISPYCYQHPPIFPFSPFNDFDVWEPGYQSSTFRDRMTTYPAQGGSIPTLQWEGLREGIIDLGYLTTLEYYLSEIEAFGSEQGKDLAAEAKSRRDRFLSRIEMRDINIESVSESDPYPHVSAVDYRDFRRQLALDICRLCAHLKDSARSIRESSGSS